MNDFQVKDYWEKRLNQDFNLNGVGYLGLGKNYNKVLYKIRTRIFLKLLPNLNLKNRSAKILDIGSGTGFYVDFFKKNGFKNVSGSDITEVVVRNLKEKYRNSDFYRLDIGEKNCVIPPNSFDVITCMDVLFHIIDDERYETALHNIYNFLKKDGYFIFSDCFLRNGEYMAKHVYMRSREKIHSMLEKTSFKIVYTKPMFVLMNEPVDTQNYILKKFFNVIYKLSSFSDTASFIIAHILYPLELTLIAILKEGPSTELMICKKVSEA